MKAIVITNKGIEDIAAKEIKELIKAKSSIKETVVILEAKNFEEICLLCYKMQSANKILYLFDNFKIKEDILSTFKEIIQKTSFDKFKKTFAVKCQRLGSHDFSSSDIEKEVGALIKYKIKKKVDLENPDIIFYIYIYENECYFGIDFSGIDLSKRDYRIFSHPTSLKGPVAYSIVRISEFKGNEAMLDPFCGSGTIPIEAAYHIASYPVNYFRKDKLQFTHFTSFDFDKVDRKIVKKPGAEINAYDIQMQHVKAAQKNAKIGGVNKYIHFSRVEIEWLDTKLKEKSVDKIITQPPALSKYSDEKTIKKTYNELFYQAKYVLKDNGKVVTISTSDLTEFAKKHGFKLSKKMDVWQGDVKLYVCIFAKQQPL